jgi:hypothetical protein
MTAIQEFVIDKMSSYVAGGMKPETAARFTRGELLSIYRGDHWSRDVVGKPQKTPPPEALDIETAMRKADAAIAEILDYCAKERAEKGQPLNAETHPAPDAKHTGTMSGARKTGLDGLKKYVRESA